MALSARTRTHRSKTTPPLDEFFVACQVCGMQVDAEKTASPAQEQITHVTTGTTYHSSDVASINKDVEPRIGRYASCFFAGAPTGLGRKTPQR